MDSWDELDALVSGLREANAEWAKSADALQQQLDGFREVTEQIERYFAELGVYEALSAISRRALNDAARIHSARLNYGLTHSAAMLWYPLDDPRAELSGAPPEATYSIEVRIGPHYLLGVQHEAGAAGDQRVSVLIAGEKQLVATLPTSPEKFRAALLRAFGNPQRSGPPAAGDTAEPGTGTAEAAASTETSSANAQAGADEPEPEPAPARASAAGAERTEAASTTDAVDTEPAAQTSEAAGENVIELPGPAKEPGRKRSPRKMPRAES